MLLVLDVGNTNIVAGVYEGAARVFEARFETLQDATAEQLSEQMFASLAPFCFEEVAIASVVPPIETALETFCIRDLNATPFFLRSERESGMRVRYQPPASLGIDRLCNAVAALESYGAPVIVIDFGTATKLEAVGSDGDYLGGAILPGVGVSMEALFRNAARLHEVEWTLPAHAIGRSTKEALQSGFVFGFAGQAEALIHRFRQEMGSEVPVVATGGWASSIVPACPSIQTLDATLTLEGVRRLYGRQKGREVLR